MANKSSALPIVAGGAALLLLSSSKKKKKKSSGPRSRWGVSVSKDCNTVTVVNQDLFNQFLYGAYDELVSIDPSLTLIQITDALFGEVAPTCSGFPEQPESSEIAELYAVIARAVGSYLVTDSRTKDSIGSLIDEATEISFVDWYIGWRNYPSPEIPDKPSNQVAFSSDLSGYDIGPSWFEENVRPFVQNGQNEGWIDSAYEKFIDSAGVMVGRFIMPIKELPQDVPSVKDFLSKVEEAIQAATAEVFKG